MMKQRVADLVKQGNGLFDKKKPLDSYWQTLAEQFYPERADFTSVRTISDDPADTGLMTAIPVLARRELGNQISAMLRPKGQPWFSLQTDDEDLNQQHGIRKYMERLTKVQRRAMLDPQAKFVRATKEGDHDWVTFGNAVISVDLSYGLDTLLYRCWHLRDCAWGENENGDIDVMHRRWTPTARQVMRSFGDRASKETRLKYEKDPDCTIKCRHVVLPRELYDYDPKKAPKMEWISIYVEEEGEAILDEKPAGWFPYVVPRWATISGSQYGWSPATGPGLSEGRTMQSVMRVLLEAGEKAVDPPMVATQDAVRSDIALYAGGVTWVDQEYDERLGEALRPIAENRSVPIGMDIADRLARVIAEGFFLNKLNLPGDMGKMTAFEVRKRVEESLRAAAPLLDPAEDEYNAPLVERSFQALVKVGAFGDMSDMPPELRGRNVIPKFKSPMVDLADEVDAQKLIQGFELVGAAANFDQSQVTQMDLDKGVRAGLRGIGWPEEWMGEEEAPEKVRDMQIAQVERQNQMQELQAGVGMAQQAADAVGTVGSMAGGFGGPTQ